jgi:CRP-like cAMP-binding protein
MAQAQLKRAEVFDFLRSEQVNALSEAAETVKFKSGDTVYEKGQKAQFFYIVLSGQVSLRLPGQGGVSILIDELTPGSMFGSCVFHESDTYVLMAQCAESAELLKIKTSALRRLLDNDARLGYAIQSRISHIYFERYIEAVKKLQAIVSTLPFETD